jgi:cell division protein ZapA
MERRKFELRVGGKSYRVVSSAPEDEVQRAALLLSEKVDAVGPVGNGLFLAAMALAFETLSERDRRVGVERRTRDLLRRWLARVEHALEPIEVEARADRPAIIEEVSRET